MFRWSQDTYLISIRLRRQTNEQKLLSVKTISFLGSSILPFIFILFFKKKERMNFNNQMIKIVLAGNTSVGKTCLIHRLIQFKYIEGFHQTIATAAHDWTANVGKRSLDIKIWDTAGQERYRTLAPVYFRDASAAVVVFDATEEDPIDDLREWINTFRENARSGAVIIIAANKCDLVEDQSELQSRINKVKEEFQLECLPTSAKSGQNVTEVFQYAAEEISKAFPTDILMASELNEKEGEFCSC